MRRPVQSAIPSRAIAIGLALLAHVLLLLLLVLGMHSPPRAGAEQLLFVSLWPELRPPTPDLGKVNSPPSAPPSRGEKKPSAPDVAPSEGPRPAEVSTAITPALPSIDWQREGAAAAKRQSERPRELETFSAPPKTARKPCEPSKSSFVWNPETPRAGFTKTPIPLPFVQLGKRCVVGLGFFSCNLSALPDPNSQLFDDVKEGKTMEPSVPDANVCD